MTDLMFTETDCYNNIIFFLAKDGEIEKNAPL